MPIAKHLFFGSCSHPSAISKNLNLHQNHFRRSLICSMDTDKDNQRQTETKIHVHYNHTHPSKYARWNARESFEFMNARPWQRVNDFYLNSVRGNLSFPLIFGTQVHHPHYLVLIIFPQFLALISYFKWFPCNATLIY